MTVLPSVKIIGIDQIEVLVVLPADHRIAAVDFPWKQSHPLVARRRSGEWCQPERSKIRRFEQLGADRPAAIGCVSCVERFPSIVIEFDEPGILDAVCLSVGDRKDDAFAQLFLIPEHHFDVIAIWRIRAAADLWDRGKTRSRIDGDAAVGGYGAGPECQR